MAQTTTEARARPDTARALRQAAELVSSAIGDLNRRSAPCSCCGLRRAENFTEAQAYEQLAGVSSKLRRWARTLEHPEQQKPEPHEHDHDDSQSTKE